MQGINGTAEIIQTTNSSVDLDKIIGRNAFSLQKILDMEPDFLKVPLNGTFTRYQLSAHSQRVTANCSLGSAVVQSFLKIW